ncbi:hypothetical protein HII36_00250 [Nonomuraea sp. NN258]|uniref:hypothetical protein n=1 Tax=Nonomuraea antri TaxID=2730852 RepID=UPI0015696810|nr:hypothetical protein [Nonomuraea antri]NRQ30274.1 hypothetical protein [Nonomuraea antri]
MKRRRLAIVLAMAVGLCTVGGPPVLAATAQDPAGVLREQFVPGRGVLVDETIKTTVDRLPPGVTRTTGKIGFSASRADGFDLTSRWTTDGVAETTRTVKVGRYTYVLGFEWGTMPAWPTWVRFGDGSTWNNGWRGYQPLDVFDPKILRTLVAKAATVKGSEYRGVFVPGKRSGDASVGDSKRVTFSYRLFLDARQLPVRLITDFTYVDTWPDDKGKWVEHTVHDVVDTRYDGWGTKVSITPPPAGDVVDITDVLGSAAENRNPTDGATWSLAR